MSSDDWPAFRRKVKPLGARGQKSEVRKNVKSLPIERTVSSPLRGLIAGRSSGRSIAEGVSESLAALLDENVSADKAPTMVRKGVGFRVKPGMTPTIKTARNLKPFTLDLHGMTQDAAHAALSTFLATQYQHGTRQVLIITGKGRGGEGLLKRNLPHWCENPALLKFIDSITIAPARLGGSGAFVVMLRRKN